jgi:hypothetical protein
MKKENCHGDDEAILPGSTDQPEALTSPALYAKIVMYLGAETLSNGQL